MRKLEDIPKKSVFNVPDSYFEQLPTKIQARMAEQNRTATSSFAILSLKYALPFVILVIVGVFWLRPAPSMDEQLDNIDTEQLVLYLENTERADVDEDSHEWTKSDLDQLEDAVYSDMEFSNEDLLDDLDPDNL